MRTCAEGLNQDTKAPTDGPATDDCQTDLQPLHWRERQDREHKFMLHGDRAGLCAVDDLFSGHEGQASGAGAAYAAHDSQCAHA